MEDGASGPDPPARPQFGIPSPTRVHTHSAVTAVLEPARARAQGARAGKRSWKEREKRPTREMGEGDGPPPPGGPGPSGAPPPPPAEAAGEGAGAEAPSSSPSFMETWAAAGEGEGGGGGRGGAGAAAGPREGTLEIAVASASNLPNTQLFGRQDPYVELRVGGRVEKSRSCNDGGTRPVWNEIFTFGTKGDKRFTLLVWNSCWLRKDKLMYAPAEVCVRAREVSDRRIVRPHPPPPPPAAGAPWSRSRASTRTATRTCWCRSSPRARANPAAASRESAGGGGVDARLGEG